MIDPAKLLAMPPIETSHSFTARDCMLYALGLGATDLSYVYERDLQALASMAVVLAYPGFFWTDPAYGADWKRILHGEQSVTIHRPLPTEGEFRGTTRFEGVADKGSQKGAIVLYSRDIEDSDGVLYATDRRTAFLRGDGGCGSAGIAVPRPGRFETTDEPDHVVSLTTRPEQALLYRLSGDYNPLHADPDVARESGFDAPILHGLCTYGIACLAITQSLCAGKASAIRKLDVRFAGTVFPGETIETRIWETGQGTAVFEAFVTGRDAKVLSMGRVELK